MRDGLEYPELHRRVLRNSLDGARLDLSRPWRAGIQGRIRTKIIGLCDHTCAHLPGFCHWLGCLQSAGCRLGWVRCHSRDRVIFLSAVCYPYHGRIERKWIPSTMRPHRNLTKCSRHMKGQEIDIRPRAFQMSGFWMARGRHEQVGHKALYLFRPVDLPRIRRASCFSGMT